MTFCILDAHCAVYDAQSKLSGLAYFEPICSACDSRSRSELNLLRYDYVDLSQLIPKAGGHNDVRIYRPRPESSPPITLAAWIMRTEIAYVVANTRAVLQRFLGARPGPAWPTREGWRLDNDTTFLGNHVGDIARIPATELIWSTEAVDPTYRTGPDMLLVLGDLHRRARKLCGLDPRTIAVPGNCPGCNIPALRRRDDDPSALWCNHCRKRLTSVDYSQLVKMQLPPPAPA